MRQLPLLSVDTALPQRATTTTAFNKIVTQGTCESAGYQMITSAVECEAANNFFANDGLSVRHFDQTDDPKGCYMNLWGTKRLDLNNGESTVECSTTYRCLCSDGRLLH